MCESAIASSVGHSLFVWLCDHGSVSPPLYSLSDRHGPRSADTISRQTMPDYESVNAVCQWDVLLAF